jgi:hypothetical protein
MDKNHPANAIENVLRVIQPIMPKSVEYSFVYLVPEITNQSVDQFPFSYEFFGQCFCNGQNRKDHATLSNENVPKLFAIQLMFLLMNKNIAFN